MIKCNNIIDELFRKHVNKQTKKYYKKKVNYEI